MRMRTQWAGRYRSLLVSVIGWALGLFLITACGTLELGVEATLPASSTSNALLFKEFRRGLEDRPGQIAVVVSRLSATRC